ncbi:Crp/Fnr family transcriptional regulator [Sphingomonas sp. LHG3406-1]|uniref:Crp/Fnr family transcriptional regulator n=1 Tax=Sphingomonas sp. LHG3406-1 TaxID=2804617 RepID=UPI0026182E53|nr:Crp/Fnr family transcriptional regulator [Sphingomonas sp. LHG3406-1]
MSVDSAALLTQRLSRRAALTSQELEELGNLPYSRRRLAPATYLVREGEPVTFCAILLEGCAIRHKIVRDGGRQIVSLCVPGDALDFQSLYLEYADHNIQTLTYATVDLIPVSAFRDLTSRCPGVAKAISKDILIDCAMLREQVTSLGRRDGRTRFAHALCEFAARSPSRLSQDVEHHLTITQEQMGDLLGLTTVHVSRLFKDFEKNGLIDRNRGTITYQLSDELIEEGDFNSLYLHGDEVPLRSA